MFIFRPHLFGTTQLTTAAYMEIGPYNCRTQKNPSQICSAQCLTQCFAKYQLATVALQPMVWKWVCALRGLLGLKTLYGGSCQQRVCCTIDKGKVRLQSEIGRAKCRNVRGMERIIATKPSARQKTPLIPQIRVT